MVARKTKSGGNAFADLDELQEKTVVKQTKADEIAGKNGTKKQPKASAEETGSEQEKSVMLGVRMTPEEKIRLQIYCAKRRITLERAIRDFIAGLEE